MANEKVDVMNVQEQIQNLLEELDECSSIISQAETTISEVSKRKLAIELQLSLVSEALSNVKQKGKRGRPRKTRISSETFADVKGAAGDFDGNTTSEQIS